MSLVSVGCCKRPYGHTDGEKEVTPACVLSPVGLFIPMLNVLCGPQSAVPYHRLPRVHCSHFPVSPNKV